MTYSQPSPSTVARTTGGSSEPLNLAAVSSGDATSIVRVAVPAAGGPSSGSGKEARILSPNASWTASTPAIVRRHLRYARRQCGIAPDGVTVESELAWPGCPPTLEAHGPVVRLREVAMASLAGADGGELIWSATVDGQDARMLRRHDGGHVLEYGAQARFVIGANHDEILVGVGSAPSAGWQRFMLDWVLLVVSHLHGYDLLHGAAVELRRPSRRRARPVDVGPHHDRRRAARPRLSDSSPRTTSPSTTLRARSSSTPARR